LGLAIGKNRNTVKVGRRIKKQFGLPKMLIGLPEDCGWEIKKKKRSPNIKN
jgi:hypothetical protein